MPALGVNRVSLKPKHQANLSNKNVSDSTRGGSRDSVAGSENPGPSGFVGMTLLQVKWSRPSGVLARTSA